MKSHQAFLFVLVAFLSGCDSRPRDADLRTAMKKQVGIRAAETGIAQAGQNATGAPRVIGCAKGELRSYICDVTGVGSGLRKVRMVKFANEDWSLAP